MPKPNLLIFMTDHQRGDTVWPSNPCLTPNVDRIAREGVTFGETFCPSPHCCPSRATFMTGLFPAQHGVWHNVDVANAISRGLNEGVRTWCEDFRDEGYRMRYSGKWHVPQRDVRRSFHVLHPGHGQGEIGDSDATRAALGWLLNRKTDRPFFLSLGLLNPHDCCFPGWPQGGPYKFSYGKQIEERLPPLPENFDMSIAQNRGAKTRTWSHLDWRYYIYNYYRMTEMVDAEIGRLYDALRRSRYAENTSQASTPSGRHPI